MEVPAELQPFALTSKFDRGELTVEVAPERVVEACRECKGSLHFERLSTVTAVDRYPSEPRFEIVYHLHSVSLNRRLRLKARVSGESPAIDSVTAVWRSANWYEREVFDLFGITFLNHPNLRRIMMPDEWVGHPLRKDYPVEGYK
ncbi:MAG: NADH-quinone oxidoreductase subunit C [Acidobacteria bacterium]|nr:NADH-quinone oxidoreductase subunit C [Acidobacteriota bacterium]MBI3473049.1 NADH-quinone oxidoreductase subunit C [Candidatus Solibacter usitatus]